MAKEKVLKLSGDRDLGAVTRKLSSGMFVTSKGEKVPPLPGITIGTKVKLTKSKFEIVEGKKKVVNSTEDADKQTIAEVKAENVVLKKRMDAMEKAQGAKGSDIKASAPAGDGDKTNADNEPPKVES